MLKLETGKLQLYFVFIFFLVTNWILVYDTI